MTLQGHQELLQEIIQLSSRGGSHLGPQRVHNKAGISKPVQILGAELDISLGEGGESARFYMNKAPDLT